MVEIKTRDNSCFPGMESWRGILKERKLKLLKSSWAGVFRDHLLETLPIHAVSLHFSKTMGRPTKELVTVVGACVFQQVFDLSDVETRDQPAFNEQWQDSFNPKDHECIASMYGYKLLQRVFSAQCRIGEDKIIVKESSEISSDSLQNPSDADATYDGHKGQGDQVQIMETYTPKTKEEPGASQEKPGKEFKEKYRYRSGIEATNSRYIHMTGAGRLNYRGLPKISYAARLKALGINLFRAARYQLQHGISVPENREIALNVA